jgi:predicted transcriptional regulator
MNTAKEEVRKMLDQIPADSSFEDIQYHIYVKQKVERGLKALEEGRYFTHEQVKKKLAKWLK